MLSPGHWKLVRFDNGGIYLMHPDGSNMTSIQGGAAIPGSWQPLPLPAPPPPPAIRAKALKGKKKLRLDRKGIATVGRVLCGSSPCTLEIASAKLKVGKKRYGVKATIAKSLAAGASAPLKIKVKGKALRVLEAKHHGRLALFVSVTDATGAERLSFGPKVLPPAKHRKKKG